MEIKKSKEEIVKLCEEQDINTVSQFLDILVSAIRCECHYNVQEHLDGVCSGIDTNQREELSKVVLKDPDDLTCKDISDRLGSCTYLNKILMSVTKYLYEIGDN